MMDLKTLRNEISKLSEIVEGWNTLEYIPEIERDLVLEKLRALYDAVRFADPMAAPQGADCVDLSEDQRPMVEYSISTSEPEPEYVPEVAPAPAPESEAVSEPEPADMPELTPELEPVVELVSVPESEPEAVAEPVGQLQPEPEAVTEPVGQLQPEPEAVTEPVVQLQPEPELMSTSDPEPEAVSEPEPTPQPAAEIYVPVAAPTLFGLDSDESEAEKLRHRHKQRVILSLYGSESARQAVESSRHASVPEQVEQPSLPNSEPIQSIPEPVYQPLESVSENPDSKSETNSRFEAAPNRASGVTPPEKYVATVQSAVEDEDDSVFEEISLTPNAVLGEVIKHDVQTLADTFAPRHDGASELRHAEPITDLRQAIGLNDKFLLIRDLFGGDGAACDQTLEILNGFDDLDDCMIYIAENYDWNPNSDGAKFIMEIIERKFA